MERYIARQPIFNRSKKVYAYELLYRDSTVGFSAPIEDADVATRSLLSDAITVFGLPKLANGKLSYVNFTNSIILSDFMSAISPNEVVVEIADGGQATPELLARLAELKEQGYTLALDNYIGDRSSDELVELMDIIKVDFRLTTQDRQRSIARRFKGQVRLLAERVESIEDFQRALDMDYSYFQGYFFEKPVVMRQKTSGLVATTYVQILRELYKPEIDLDHCARIIHADATLTYQLFRKVGTLRYYRGNSIKSVLQALVFLGSDSIRQWCMLLLARDRNVTFSEELVKEAYIRGIFIEELMDHSPLRRRRSDGYLLGMFSLLDKIMGQSLDRILADIPIPEDVTAALLSKQHNIFSEYLEFITLYGMRNTALKFPTLELDIEQDEISMIYMRCLVKADREFED